MISDVPERNMRPSTMLTCGRSEALGRHARITTLDGLPLRLGEADQHHRLLRHELASVPPDGDLGNVSDDVRGEALDAALDLRSASRGG